MLGDGGGLAGAMGVGGDAHEVVPKGDDEFGFDDGLAVFDGIFSGGGVGKGANELLDRLGVPDHVGDIVGVGVDLCMANWGGAIANGLDLGEDVALKAGHEELAGHLKKASNATGKVWGFAIKVGVMVGTAGTGNVAIGSATMSMKAITGGLGTTRAALGAGERLQAGDKGGAALAALGGLASFVPMGEAMGMKPETLQVVGEVARHATTAVGFLTSAMADGELGAEDLAYLPARRVLEAAGVEVGSAGPLVDGAVSFLGAAVGGEEGAWGPLLEGAVSSILEGGAAAEDEGQVRQGVGFLGQLLEQAGKNPELVEALGALLQRGLAGQEPVDLSAQRGRALRP